MAEQRALSQWEIDALLNDLPDGEGAEEQSGHDRRVQRSSSVIKEYDFRRPDKFSKEQWATLHSMHEHFGRLVSASLSSRLRTMVSVRLLRLEQGLYEEWQSEATVSTVCYVMSMRPLAGSVIVGLNAEIAAEVVDRLLGGNGALVDRSREFGEIEFGLLRSFSRVFGHVLQEMWSTVRPVEPTLQDLGTDASLIQIAAPTDVVLLAEFEVYLSNYRGTLSICLPYAVIEPVAAGLSAQLWIASSQQTTVSEEERQAVERLIDRSRVDVVVRLGSVELPARTIASLEEGDTFVLDARLGRPLDVVIGEQTRFRALPGAMGSHLGIQIAEVVEERTPPQRWGRRTGGLARPMPFGMAHGGDVPPPAVG